MSRLIIKNLPPYLTQTGLEAHFSSKNSKAANGAPGGLITDVKIASKSDGTSRRFGFIGYKTDEEARKAKEWFDGTYVGSTRISVGLVEGSKDAPKPRPNKRQRLDVDTDTNGVSKPSKSKDEKKSKEAKKEAKKKKGPKDTQLEEFLEVMHTRKGPSWANEAEASTSAVTLDSKVNDTDDTPDAKMDVDEPVREEGLSDLEWMRRRMSAKAAIETEKEKVFVQDDEDEEGPAAKENEQPQVEDMDPTRTTILQTSRLFVRNLAFSCTQAELEECFGKFGAVEQVHIPLDPTTQQSKGLAYVTFAKAADALTAYETLDKTSFQGRLLHILAAVDRRGNFRVEEGEGAKKSVKGTRDEQRKKVAGKEFNWSMLYMNSDAVASSIADRMNIPKTAILNPDSDDPSSSTNPAVKLALAETHIINETKAYLEANGVVLSSFSPSDSSSSSNPSPKAHRTPRSPTTILVKNIPYGTSSDAISELFAPYGTLTRVLVPPAGTIAVVEFARADEADKGFKGVAYRRLGGSVVYLEKAPLGVFSDSAPTTSSSSSAYPHAPGAIPAHAVKIREQEQEVSAEGGADPALSEGTTLFVKNLAFSTTSERLTKTFGSLPGFAFARVQTKADPNLKSGAKSLHGEGRLSMGYGFIGFKDVEGARKAMKSMQGLVLDGHALHVKFAGRGAEANGGDGKDKATGATNSKSRTTKMLVKNVPFEATKKDIRDLFGSHGTLKSVRLPKKFDSRTRGFAFLDFISRAEAERAYEALRHTHLLGRHLVLEWAEEEGDAGGKDLEALRRKAGVGFGVAGQGKSGFEAGRKRKLDMSMGKEDGHNEDDDE